MKREQLDQALSLYSSIEDMTGKYFSYEYVYKKVLQLSDEEIAEMAEQLEKEKNDPLYARFYSSGESEDGDSW
jgi:hypothetical protein